MYKRQPRYRALYDFETQEAGELPLRTGDIVELEEKEENGWWLVKKGSTEGWSPADYLELIAEPAAAKPRPPPPAKPASAKPAAAPARVSQSSVSSTWTPPDSHAAPVAVMPGMGDPGGFAAILARKKAERAAAAGQGHVPE